MTSHHNYIKKVNFASKPSAKELTFMDNLCFDSAWSEKDYLEMKRGSFFNGWLLEISEKHFVGILVFNIVFQELEILRLGIHPNWRKKGFAELMLDHLELLSIKKDLNSIFLEVHFSNFPALSLYRKKGFQEVGRRKNYFQTPKGDAILLKKLL